MASGPPPPPPRLPLPGSVAVVKRSCPCYFCLPSWLGHPLCHPHDVFHWDLTLGGTGVLAEPPAGPQPLVLTQVGGPSLSCVPRQVAPFVRVCLQVIGHLSVVGPCWPGPALPALFALCTAGTGACAVGGTGRALHVFSFFPMLCSFVPSGKI